MRRFLRKRVLIPLGLAVALVYVVYVVYVPRIVGGRVDEVLRQLKLRDVTYRVTRATPWSSTIRDIDAGNGNRIDEVRVTYSVQGLWNRRVDRVRMKGLQLKADVRDGRVTVEALDELLSVPAAATRAAVEPVATAPIERDGAWPFLGIEVEDSKLIVRTPDGEIPVSIDGRLDGRTFRLTSSLAGGTASIEGSFSDALRFSFDGVSGSDLSAILHGLAPKVPVRTAATVHGKGTASRSGDRTSFDVELALSPPAEPASPPTTQLAGTNVAVERGVFHIAGSVGAGGDESLNVAAREVTLAESTVGATASGIAGSVNFVSLSPTATAGDQVVQIERLSASKLELTDGRVQFDLAPDGSLNVDAMRWMLLGGEVSATDVRVAPGEPIKLTLVAKDVQLRELLALLAQGKATGDGKVNGRLPLVISPDGHVALGEGSAEAVAGGRLSITDEPTLHTVAGAAAGHDQKTGQSIASQAQAQVRNDVVSALKDFEFRSLTARLKDEPGKGLVAYVNMKGQGRTGARQAVDYDLRVMGFNDLFRSIIGLQRTVTREAARP